MTPPIKDYRSSLNSILLGVLCLAWADECLAQGVFDSYFAHASGGPIAQNQTNSLYESESIGLTINAIFRRYVGSETSYEFGDPFNGYAPLSKLQFPMDGWWGGAGFNQTIDRFSVSGDFVTNISSESNSMMKDSDWDDESNPKQMTIYSESYNHIDPSYLVNTSLDMKVADLLGLPNRVDLRPMMGFRYQTLNFTTHDGLQIYPGSNTPPLPLPGNGIQFNQTFYQYVLGFRWGLDFGDLIALPGSKVYGQFDWAYVEGNNTDHHLKREGQRYTYENTTGHAWHTAVGAEIPLIDQLTFSFTYDYLNISTSGTHRLVNKTFNIDYSFNNGVKAYSLQQYFEMKLAYSF